VVLDVGTKDLSPGLAKADSEEMADLEDGVLENGGLILDFLVHLPPILVSFILVHLVQDREHPRLLDLVGGSSKRVVGDDLDDL